MDQRMKYSYAAVCATGRVRTENQDRIYLNGTICGGGYAQTDGTGRKQGLFAVADGMGGQAQGAQAAQARWRRFRRKNAGRRRRFAGV